MKASEATQRVESRMKLTMEGDKKMYEKVIDKIKSDIDASKTPIYSTALYDDLSDYVIHKLREDGFTVNSSSYRNETTTIIEWPKPPNATDYYNK